MIQIQGTVGEPTLTALVDLTALLTALLGTWMLQQLGDWTTIDYDKSILIIEIYVPPTHTHR
jgi:hypothetical protein